MDPKRLEYVKWKENEVHKLAEKLGRVNIQDGVIQIDDRQLLDILKNNSINREELQRLQDIIQRC